MSNYYYDEKPAYLASLAEVRRAEHDLTAFLAFSLRGICLQSQRLLAEIQREISRELFRNLMYDLFRRLKTPRQRVIAERQIEILKILLGVDSIDLTGFVQQLAPHYKHLKNPTKAVKRDIGNLHTLGVIAAEKTEDGEIRLRVRLEWPTEITETEFFRKLRDLPKAKSHSFLP
jgi:hypothetical protein